eukprot:6210279-Pleurochrysis_carterae.AAC.3
MCDDRVNHGRLWGQVERGLKESERGALRPVRRAERVGLVTPAEVPAELRHRQENVAAPD